MTRMADDQRAQRALLRARQEALAAEEDDRRLEERRQRWLREGMHLTSAEVAAGEPCRGCGEPLLDGIGDWYPLNQLSPADQAEYDRAEARFLERHRACRSHRWSLSGHRVTHCGYCCPPTPLSDRQIERFERHFDEHGFGMWAVERRDAPGCIGRMGLLVATFPALFTPCVEIGWMLAAEHWGLGLATEGAREVLRYGFGILALDEIFSFTAVANARSRRVMEKIGLRHNPADDFDHPNLPDGHPLRRHVLYRSRREEWLRDSDT